MSKLAVKIRELLTMKIKTTTESSGHVQTSAQVQATPDLVTKVAQVAPTALKPISEPLGAPAHFQQLELQGITLKVPPLSF